MASVYYGQNAGDPTAEPNIVVESSSTNSTDIELRIDTGKNWTRKAAYEATMNILRFFISGLNTTFTE